MGKFKISLYSSYWRILQKIGGIGMRNIWKYMSISRNYCLGEYSSVRDFMKWKLRGSKSVSCVDQQKQKFCSKTAYVNTEGMWFGKRWYWARRVGELTMHMGSCQTSWRWPGSLPSLESQSVSDWRFNCGNSSLNLQPHPTVDTFQGTNLCWISSSNFW